MKIMCPMDSIRLMFSETFLKGHFVFGGEWTLGEQEQRRETNRKEIWQEMVGLCTG